MLNGLFSLTVSPGGGGDMNMNPVVALQRVWLYKLEAMQRQLGINRPILVQRYVENTWHDWHVDIPSYPYHTRSLLPCELCFDPDVRDWDVMKRGMDKLTSFMDSERIPYILAYTGGKGCHCHVFFNPNIPLPDDVVSGLQSYNIDVGREVRLFLTDWILDSAGVNPDEIELDYGKISWHKDGKGSMIRIIGSVRRPSGQFKTVIESISANKPSAGTDMKLVSPDNIRVWDISFLKQDIITLFYARIAEYESKARQEQVRAFIWQNSNTDAYPRLCAITRKCQGVKIAEKGVPEGKRDNASMGLISAYKKWFKLSIQDVKNLMRQWYIKCIPAFDISVLDDKVERLYNIATTGILLPLFI